VTAAAPGGLRRHPSGPPIPWLVGHLPAYARDGLGFFTRVAREHGGVVRIRLVHPTALVTHPDGVKRVLQDNHFNYRKSFVYGRIRPLLGDGLLTSDGSFWLRQRRLAAPAFHRERIAGLADLFARRTGEMLDGWHAAVRRGEAVDLHREMTRLTLANVGEALFSVDLDGAAADVGRAMTEALAITNRRLGRVLFVPQGIPTPLNLRFARAKRVLDRVVLDTIADRRRAGVDGDDLLGMLLAARDPDTGATMSDEQLRDEVMTMVLAGHETSAAALVWVLDLLSRHPHDAARVRDEVDAVLGGRAPTAADAPRLVHTTAVIREALRLYPPIWNLAREAVEDDEIMGFHVPAGTNVVLSPWVTHRDPAWWPDPERFDPDRFAPGRPLPHRFAFFPFAGGPRICIGAAFAMLEMQVVVAAVASRFELHASGPPPVPDQQVTLRPLGAVSPRLVPRGP
jgi:cytochrome P450